MDGRGDAARDHGAAPGTGFFVMGPQGPHGPVDVQVILEWARAGHVGRETLVWRTGLPDWITAGAVPGDRALSSRGRHRPVPAARGSRRVGTPRTGGAGAPAGARSDGARSATRARSRRPLPAVRRHEEDGREGADALRLLGLPQVQQRPGQPAPVRLAPRHPGVLGHHVRRRLRRRVRPRHRARRGPHRPERLIAVLPWLLYCLLAVPGRIRRPLVREVASWGCRWSTSTPGRARASAPPSSATCRC